MSLPSQSRGIETPASRNPNGRPDWEKVGYVCHAWLLTWGIQKTKPNVEIVWSSTGLEEFQECIEVVLCSWPDRGSEIHASPGLSPGVYGIELAIGSWKFVFSLT